MGARVTGYGYSGKPQIIKIPKTGYYKLIAYGGQGGSAKPSLSSSAVYTGGLGAKVSGVFLFSAGEELKVVVGGAGRTGYNAALTYDNGGGGGGGGGTFVFENFGTGANGTLLEVAGGGGGAGVKDNGLPGVATYQGSNGNFGSGGGAGGAAEKPGAGGTYTFLDPNNQYPGGGGGYAGGRGGHALIDHLSSAGNDHREHDGSDAGVIHGDACNLGRLGIDPLPQTRHGGSVLSCYRAQCSRKSSCTKCRQPESTG